MDSNPTLHDFVLHLITNQDARLAFQLDPQGSLRSAGLGDLTPADVHDVVPLVVDLTPARTILPELGTGGLADDPATAIGQLQQIVHQLPVVNGTANVSGSSDVNVATLGAITTTPAVAGIGATASAGYDVGLTLDAVPAALGGQLGNGLPLDIVTSPVGTATGGLLGGLGAGGSPGGIQEVPLGGAAGTLDDLTGGLTGGLAGGLTGELTGGLTGHLTGELSGTIGGLTGTAGGLTGTLDGTLGTVDGTLGGVTGTVGGLTGTVGGLTGGLTGGLPGTVGGGQNSDPDMGIGDPAVNPHQPQAGVGGVVGGVVGNVVGGIADPHNGGLLGGITDGLL